MSRAAVIGYGEIGSAIAGLYRRAQLPEPRVVDPALGRDEPLDDVDVVHVCVPAHAVDSVVTSGARRLWIVHSTVPVGTCRRLAARVGGMIVHAPVRGIHPNLVEGLSTFTMPVGGRREVVPDAVRALVEIGVRATAFGKWENTELAKLLCTLRYGLDILFMRHVHEMCGVAGADFRRVYTEWTKQYNDGYDVMGQWWFHRPILKPMPGPIGGHCVVPNARLLPDSLYANLVADAGPRSWGEKSKGSSKAKRS